MHLRPIRRVALAFATLSALAAGTAQAEVVAANPMGVLKALQDYGYAATMSTDNTGDPKISAKVSKSNFVVFFYGCTDNADCASVQFYVGYDVNGTVSALKMNEWNRNKLFSKATVDDEGDPALEMDVNLDFDGSGDQNFNDTLDIWRLSIEEFEEFIDW
ncbi:MAG: YbjN domain-containing protein [Rhodobacteraceae bacterium]|nr:YbjN domain-containing protein [Paracoccaceae bacterium]